VTVDSGRNTMSTGSAARTLGAHNKATINTVIDRSVIFSVATD
jgi:hypothetical protein